MAEMRKKITKYINFKDSAFIWVKVDTHRVRKEFFGARFELY